MNLAPGVLRSGLAVAAVAVLLGAPGVAAAGQLGKVDPSQTRWYDGVGSAPLYGAAADAPANPGRSGDPVRTAARNRIDAALAGQAQALSRGDAAGYLAPVDPALHAVVKRRFEALRAVRASGFTAQVVGDPTPDGARWRATVEVRFCAASQQCAAAPAQSGTVWVLTDSGARLLEQGQSTSYGPRPWEASELRAVVGSRVVMAAPPRYASRLSPTLAAAEKAAAQADRYARWRPKPARYVVYLAGPEEWSTWYGVKQPSWAAGFAMPLTAEYTEIVLNANRIDSGEIVNTLTHEFAHVTTLPGVQRNYTDSWLLVEGLAEYATHGTRSVGSYPWLSGTRRYVDSGRWPGTAKLAAPADSATVSDATGRYGVAYLAVRRLADRYGEEKLLAFFSAVARDGTGPVEASTAIFGAPWGDVAADCDGFVRSSVR